MSSPEPSEASEPSVPSAAPDDDRGVSRRLLLGGGLLVLGAVGGGVAGFVLTDPPREVVPDPVPPADVLAAIAREQTLLTAYDAALAAGTGPALLTHVRAEHAAHVEALTALLPAEGSAAASTATPSGSSSASASTPVATPPTTADLVAAETAAAAAARTACLAGNGTAAVLLACIAASETSHAAVLA